MYRMEEMIWFYTNRGVNWNGRFSSQLIHATTRITFSICKICYNLVSSAPKYLKYILFNSLYLRIQHFGLLKTELTNFWLPNYLNCGKFWKRWEYQTTWPASWETYMQVRQQQLELDMEQQTDSK